MADWLFILYSVITFTEYLRPLKNFHIPPSTPFLAIKANIHQNWPKKQVKQCLKGTKTSNKMQTQTVQVTKAIIRLDHHQIQVKTLVSLLKQASYA